MENLVNNKYKLFDKKDFPIELYDNIEYINSIIKREQNAFMEGYSCCQKEYEEKLKFTTIEEKTPEYSEKLLLKCSDGTFWIGYYLRHKNRQDAFYSYIEPDIECAIYDVIEWRYFFI